MEFSPRGTLGTWGVGTWGRGGVSAWGRGARESSRFGRIQEDTAQKIAKGGSLVGPAVFFVIFAAFCESSRFDPRVKNLCSHWQLKIRVCFALDAG